MKYDVSYCSQNHKILLDKFIGVGLESPSRNGPIDSESAIRFSGWLALKSEHTPSIYIKSGSDSYTFNCDIKRDDVSKHFSEKNIPIHDAVGFSFYFKNNSNFEFYINICGENIKVWTIVTSNKPQPAYLSFLKTIHLDKEAPATLDAGWNDLIANISPEHFSFISKTDYSALKEKHEIFSNKNNISKFFDEICDPYWNVKSIESALTNGKLHICGLSSDEPIYCLGSVTIDDFNFLIFSDKGLPFFVVQHLSITCIIFPTLLITIDVSVREWCNVALQKLRDLYSYLRGSNFPHSHYLIDHASFIGIHISQSRPYHSFYDVLQGLYILRKYVSNFESDKINLILNDHMSFFSDEIYQNILSINSIKFEHYKNRIFSIKGGFTLFPAIQYSSIRDTAVINNMSNHLQNYLLSECDTEITDKQAYDYIIWIGISTEKRAWIEQTDGWSKILHALSEEYRLLVIVDGRTFAIEAMNSDIRIKNAEDEIFYKIKDNCPNVGFINAIGMRAPQKIQLANHIDLFVTSYATDSIYPSCISKKPGIVYSPHQIGTQKYLHIHHNIIEIDQSLINSQVEDPSIPWHHISVSIDWQEILKLIRYRLNNI